ncbi:uncharacterized protein [Epargyreus clarus]|uniref:uncharacterized protein n=1 Tax=Epargyreus clarus TaxID=520877 RepID=UPI003C2E309A
MALHTLRNTILDLLKLRYKTRYANNTNQPVHPRFINPNAVLRQVFEMLRFLIKNGNADMVPVLDPMEFEYQSFAIKLPNKLLTYITIIPNHISLFTFSLNANFTNGILEGLGDFEVVSVEFIKSEIAVDLSITFPLLKITAGKYLDCLLNYTNFINVTSSYGNQNNGKVDLNGPYKPITTERSIIIIIPLLSHCWARVSSHNEKFIYRYEILNFKFWTKIYLKQSEDGQSILIDRFHESQFSVDKISSHTDFDENIDNIFNALTEDLLAEYLNRFSKIILMKYSDSVVESINPFLNEFETWRFIAAIL